MILNINVRANAKKRELIINRADNSATIYTTKIAKDNKANIDVIDIISDYFKVPKNNIVIKKGLRTKNKIVEILE